MRMLKKVSLYRAIILFSFFYLPLCCMEMQKKQKKTFADLKKKSEEVNRFQRELDNLQDYPEDIEEVNCEILAILKEAKEKELNKIGMLEDETEKFHILSSLLTRYEKNINKKIDTIEKACEKGKKEEMRKQEAIRQKEEKERRNSIEAMAAFMGDFM